MSQTNHINTIHNKLLPCPICGSNDVEQLNRNKYLHLEQILCKKCKGYWLQGKYGIQTSSIREYVEIQEPKSRW